ncbi:MAG: hypothetical protein LRY71_10365 [Bacillaceae bacterium]|nr:hypothetical protein [Bacillaceae bacterium]
MMTELGRAQTIISDYLTLAKPEAETLVPIDVKQQVEQIVQTIRPFAFMKNVVLTLTFSGEGAVVFGNVKKNSTSHCKCFKECNRSKSGKQ